MSSKKRMLLGILISSIIVLSVVSVSAGFWDLFKKGTGGEDLEGELAASYEATVQLANAAPTIVAFRPTDDFQSDGTAGTGVNPGEVAPIGNGIIFAAVTFIVQDPNQPNDLPGVGTGPAISVGSAGNIEVDITSPADAASSVRCKAGSCRVRSASSGVVAGTDFPSGLGLTSACKATTCVGGGNPNCNADTVAAGDGSDFSLQVEYTCYVAMKYWDEPSVSTKSAGDDFWTISVKIKDSAGTSDTVTSGTTVHAGVTTYNFDAITCTGVGDCDYINYLTVKLADATGPVSWTSVSVDVGDDPADTATDLGITNLGNEAVASVNVKGQDLLGVASNGITAVSTSTMSATAFTANEVTEEVATGSQCSDGIDNPDPEDILIDMDDPGCASSLDNNEVDAPPLECAGDALVVNTDVPIAGVNVPFTAGGAADSGIVDTDNLYFCIDKVLSSSTCVAGATPCMAGALTASYAAKNDVPNGFANPWEITFV